jgi:hypothetical protein
MMPTQGSTTPSKSRAGVTLLKFLNDYKPEVPNVADSATKGQNTRNDESYGYEDIPESVPTWEGFNFKALQKRFRRTLKLRVEVDSVEISPQKGK